MGGSEISGCGAHEPSGVINITGKWRAEFGPKNDRIRSFINGRIINAEKSTVVTDSYISISFYDVEQIEDMALTPVELFSLHIIAAPICWNLMIEEQEDMWTRLMSRANLCIHEIELGKNDLCEIIMYR